MTIQESVQKLEPGGLVTLYTLDTTTIGGTEVLRFHGHFDPVIYWQGEEYGAWPIQADGFGRTSAQQPTPMLRVGNINKSITQLCRLFDDLVGARLTRQRTFVEYLDAENFPGGNPSADPTQQYQPEIWFIERKANEIREFVEFELASPLNFQGVMLPKRQIVANQCTWPQYRGPGCAYAGPPVATELDVPTSDPAQDKCGRRLFSCSLREWPDGVLNFGSYPAAGLIRQ